jgi:phosphatidylserine decarboxylase
MVCGMNKTLVVRLLKHLPQGAISRVWGWLARLRRPRIFVKALKYSFVRITGIDMGESEHPIDTFDTLEDLFVRQLCDGARPIDANPSAWVSPVDGCVGAFGAIKNDTLLQVKGKSYSLSRLLDDSGMAEMFEGGAYLTIYLAPHNYHRIHSPCEGLIQSCRHIPGALMPVYPESLRYVDELFASNERVVSYIQTAQAGLVSLVKVGATLVGRISVVFDPSIQTNAPGKKARSVHYDAPMAITKGGQLGAFELGSTVVLLSQPGKVTYEDLSEGQALCMGQKIGSIPGLCEKQ